MMSNFLIERSLSYLSTRCQSSTTQCTVCKHATINNLSILHLITSWLSVPGANMRQFPFFTLVILSITSQAVAQDCDNKGCALHTMLIVGKGITIIQNFSHFGTYDLWPTNLWPCRSLDLPILLLLALKLSSLAASKLAQSVRARPSVVPCWPGPRLLLRPGGVLQLLALRRRLCHQPRVPGQIIHLSFIYFCFVWSYVSSFIIALKI